MTDLEATKLCAEAMGYSILAVLKHSVECSEDGTGRCAFIYNPLQNEAQAMELMRRFVIQMDKVAEGYRIRCEYGEATDVNILHAIVKCVAKYKEGRMTDLEATKLCAEAMGYEIDDSQGFIQCWKPPVPDNAMAFRYDPLKDLAQALELVKYLKLDITWTGRDWRVVLSEYFLNDCMWVFDTDLNRAIVESVAYAQGEKRKRNEQKAKES